MFAAPPCEVKYIFKSQGCLPSVIKTFFSKGLPGRLPVLSHQAACVSVLAVPRMAVLFSYPLLGRERDIK